MKSLQTKIISMVLCCTLLIATIVLGVGIVYVEQILDKDSAQILKLLCTEKAAEIDETLGDIEQSVNTLYYYALAQIESHEDLFNREEEFLLYTEKMRELGVISAQNTKGAIAAYFRFAPEISSTISGFLIKKEPESGVFLDFELTDLSKYERDDVEHVGWYYLPLDAKEPLWLMPYQNKNLDVKMISYVIPVYQGETTIGVIGMDIDITLLSDMVGSDVIYETGYAFLLDTYGNLVYHPLYPEGIKKEDFDDELSALSETVMETQEKKEAFTYTWNNVRQQMMPMKLSNGMYLTIAAPLREINSPKWALFQHALILIVITLLFTVFITYKWVSRLIRPLKQLTEASEKIAGGDLEITIECNTKDEVGILADSFRKTAKSLREYIEHINRLAYTDILTGIRNKTAYDNKTALLDTRIADGTADFALVLMDINYLKETNDTYGHHEGDNMIVDAASIMKKTFGDNTVYRIGGDEFAAILPSAPEDGYEGLIERFDKEIILFQEKSDKVYAKNFQIARGLAAYNKTRDKTFAAVSIRADSLMYENKRWKKSAT